MNLPKKARNANSFISLFRKIPREVSLNPVILGNQAPATRWLPNKEGTAVRKGK